MTIDPTAIYLPKEVAEILRCGKSTLYEMADHNEIQHLRLGAGKGSLRFQGSDILAFLESRRRGVPKETSFKRLGL